ncbi:MAG TPA: DUF4382 domain-containing protein [Chitinophagaceae bacterium]
MKATLLFALLTLTFMGLFYACTLSGASSGSTTFKVNLTDNPFDAAQVSIDLKEVRVNNQQDSEEWTVLPTKAGIYNLLDLQNGVTTTIAEGTVDGNILREVKLVLGTRNSIKIGNEVYPLTIPGGSEKGLRIKTGRTLRQGRDSVTIDFDAGLSVHKQEDGTYMLEPVLKLK